MPFGVERAVQGGARDLAVTAVRLSARDDAGRYRLMALGALDVALFDTNNPALSRSILSWGCIFAVAELEA